MDDGVSATESGDMDQRPKHEDLEGHLASSMAYGGEVAVDKRKATEEANS